MGATNSTCRETTLETSRGSLRGITQTDNTTKKPICSRYTRIPYALPPVGALRWRRPVPLPADFSFNKPSSGEPGNYTEFGNVCPQPVYQSATLENPNAAPQPENVQSEDCLYLNVWVPTGEVPEGGWPVQVYLHGGWLQIGDAMQNNSHDPFDLLKAYPRIIISPTYRLNIFGFLASPELAEENESAACGNYGFWDQRLAIEWVHANISMFGGNPDNLTVGGLSAGAHSAIFQLHYDTYRPENERLIKRAFFYSNAVSVQPKATTSSECQSQFNELLTALSIPLNIHASEKLSALRKIPDHDLVSKIPSLKQHTFRATTDGHFICPDFLKSIHDGSFTTLLSAHNIKILIGEVANEETLYRLVNPATSLRSLETQLNNYYPTPVTTALLSAYFLPSASASEKEWADIGGRILGDCQVHAVIRGFTNSLLNPPPGSTPLPISSVHRYRIAFRARGLDAWLDPDVKCCHASDIPLWWLSGLRAGFSPKDEETAKKGLLAPFYAFIKGEEEGVKWGTERKDDVRVVMADGRVEISRDELWDDGLRIWDVIAKAQGF